MKVKELISIKSRLQYGLDSYIERIGQIQDIANSKNVADAMMEIYVLLSSMKSSIARDNHILSQEINSIILKEEDDESN